MQQRKDGAHAQGNALSASSEHKDVLDTVATVRSFIRQGQDVSSTSGPNCFEITRRAFHFSVLSKSYRDFPAATLLQRHLALRLFHGDDTSSSRICSLCSTTYTLPWALRAARLSTNKHTGNVSVMEGGKTRVLFFSGANVVERSGTDLH